MVLQTAAGAAGGDPAVLALAAAGSESAGVTDEGQEQVGAVSSERRMHAKGLHPTLQCIPAFFGGHESRAHGQEELLTPQ